MSRVRRDDDGPNILRVDNCSEVNVTGDFYKQDEKYYDECCDFENEDASECAEDHWWDHSYLLVYCILFYFCLMALFCAIFRCCVKYCPDKCYNTCCACCEPHFHRCNATRNRTERTRNRTEQTRNRTERTRNITEPTRNRTERTRNRTERTRNRTERTRNRTERTRNRTRNRTSNISTISANIRQPPRRPPSPSAPPSSEIQEDLFDRLPRSKALDYQCTGNSCSICMDEYDLDSDLVTLPCLHFFHYECSKEWLSRKNECPVCRTPVD